MNHEPYYNYNYQHKIDVNKVNEPWIQCIKDQKVLPVIIQVSQPCNQETVNKQYHFWAQNNIRIQGIEERKRKDMVKKKKGKLCASFGLMLQNKSNMLYIITMTGGGVLRYLALDESFNIFI